MNGFKQKISPACEFWPNIMGAILEEYVTITAVIFAIDKSLSKPAD
jgi:hypothetical protein